MHRRHFIFSAGAAGLLPTIAGAYSADRFSPELWRTLRKDENPVILNFRASWSLTCQIKADILAKLIATQPSYAQLNFVEVDWDTFGPSVLTSKMRVTRNSTLLILKEGREIARLENEPYPRKVQAFLDKALVA